MKNLGRVLVVFGCFSLLFSLWAGTQAFRPLLIKNFLWIYLIAVIFIGIGSLARYEVGNSRLIKYLPATTGCIFTFLYLWWLSLAQFTYITLGVISFLVLCSVVWMRAEFKRETMKRNIASAAVQQYKKIRAQKDAKRKIKKIRKEAK